MWAFSYILMHLFEMISVEEERLVEEIYAARIDWIIWKIAEPHTTNINKANSQGPTGYWFSFDFFKEKQNKEKKNSECQINEIIIIRHT